MPKRRAGQKLAAVEAGPGRHLGPVELHDLTRPVAGALCRTHLRRPQLAQPPADDVDRARVAVVGAQNLRRPRRLDLRPRLDEPPQQRLERVELRARCRTLIAGWLVARRQARDWRSAFGMEGIRLEAGDNLRAWRRGSVGWLADRPRFVLPDGSVIETRLTAVALEEDGDWKLVQAHFSVAIPDEEAAAAS